LPIHVKTENIMILQQNHPYVSRTFLYFKEEEWSILCRSGFQTCKNIAEIRISSSLCRQERCFLIK